jgi:hypothetical protein
MHFIWYVAVPDLYPGRAVDLSKVVTVNIIGSCELYSSKSHPKPHLFFSQGGRLIVNMQRLATPQRPEPAVLTTDFYNIEYFRD